MESKLEMLQFKIKQFFIELFCKHNYTIISVNYYFPCEKVTGKYCEKCQKVKNKYE
jgi:hypothetical protein